MFINDGGDTFKPSFTVWSKDQSLAPTSTSSAGSAAWGDVNNDGTLDLLKYYKYGINQGLIVWINEQDGAGSLSFTDGTAASGLGAITHVVQFFGFGDLDGDGSLDLMLAANRIWVRTENPSPFSLPLLLTSTRLDCASQMNDGNGFFTLLTGGPSGVTDDASAAVFGDMNGDGFLDIFVTYQENKPNALWLNNGGTGTNLAFTAASTDPAGGSAYSNVASMADINGDGLLDLFVGNGPFAGGPNELWLNSLCPSGVRLATGACAECKSFAAQVGNVRCVECPAHTVRDAGGSCADCAPGSERLLGSEACTPCAPGSAWLKGSACSVCSDGQYASGNGSVTCTACPVFSTSSASGSTTVHDCTCVEGYYFDIDADGRASCQQCRDVLEFSTTRFPGATSADECG